MFNAQGKCADRPESLSAHSCAQASSNAVVVNVVPVKVVAQAVALR